MKVKHLSKDFANTVYDVLVSLAGASEEDRSDFIYIHCESEYGCLEYRFCGKFGFGGKYKSSWNGISYYPEDETPERKKLQKTINSILEQIIVK